VACRSCSAAGEGDFGGRDVVMKPSCPDDIDQTPPS
jgi:hypothetical protein